MAKEMTKRQIVKAHKIAREIPKGKVNNPYAVATSVVKKQAEKRRKGK
jgi:hypothetical protein